ncbi:uncharacterized protein I303_106147 [Kwoniella dejecticola CBS 10117]|uniref:Uncharacterized protein n=1 Tax=Kwoniella dejecticola CBS 10117 TaxID=1296121 RepID=A0AAJ8MJ16_9TREE
MLTISPHHLQLDTLTQIRELDGLSRESESSSEALASNSPHNRIRPSLAIRPPASPAAERILPSLHQHSRRTSDSSAGGTVPRSRRLQSYLIK